MEEEEFEFNTVSRLSLLLFVLFENKGFVSDKRFLGFAVVVVDGVLDDCDDCCVDVSLVEGNVSPNLFLFEI